jgi:hypothetical protein
MTNTVRGTKVFAVLSLIFASYFAANAQTDPAYILRAGTRIQLEMVDPIGSAFSNAGDTFRATVVTPTVNKGVVVLPIGTIVEGRISKVTDAGQLGRGGEIEAVFETIKFRTGEIRRIDGRFAKPLREKPARTRNLISIVGGTLGGALIGGLTGSRNGILIGAGVGALAGTGTAVAMTGKKADLKAGDEFEIELKSDVTLPIREF